MLFLIAPEKKTEQLCIFKQIYTTVCILKRRNSKFLSKKDLYKDKEKILLHSEWQL